MSGATRTLYLDDEFLLRTVGNVRRLNSLPGRLPGAFFFDRRPAAVPAAWLFVVIEIAELLPGAVLHDTGGADVLD